MSAGRRIALLDADAFFAECERLANPRLVGKPVLVVGDAKRRSVVLTASYEARAFGAKTGMVLHEARKLCPQARVVEMRPNFYLDVSRRIEEIVLRFTDRVEMSSVDEAYFDLTDVIGYFRKPALEICRDVQRTIKEELGLPVTIGIGPNKLIGKLLADLAKPAGVREVGEAEVPGLLEDMPVDKLCGIGSRMGRALAGLGIRTCGELGGAPMEVLAERFGVIGWTLKQMGLGRDASPVRTPDEWDPAKSVGHAHTLPRNTSDPDVVWSYLHLLCEKVAARLRKYGLAGGVAHVYVRTSEFEGYGQQKRMSVATSDGADIFGVAKDILDGAGGLLVRAGRGAFPTLRMVGVTVSDLVERNTQPFLLGEIQRREELNDAVDRINERFGRRTVRSAVELVAERFGILETPVPPRAR